MISGVAAYFVGSGEGNGQDAVERGKNYEK